MVNVIKLSVSSQRVTFTPDDIRNFSRSKELPEDGDFQVTVVNTSSKFASFQIELLPKDGDIPGSTQWYRVTPYVSAKKPPGASTTFGVTLLKSPLPKCDVTIPIVVRAYSIELEDLLAEATVWLRIDRPKQTLYAYLPIDKLTVYPGEKLLIHTLVYNLNPHAREITLSLKGLDPEWFPDKAKRVVQVDAGDLHPEVFECVPPPGPESQHKDYNIQLIITDKTQNSASASGSLTVLPFGDVKLRGCDQPTSVVSSWRTSSWRTYQRLDTATFQLTLQNVSNLPVRAVTAVTTDRSEFTVKTPDEGIKLELNEPEPKPLEVTVEVNRPWWGPPRNGFLRATPTLTTSNSGELIKQVEVRPSDQTLELNIRPVVPWVVQLGGGLLGLLLLWLAWLLHPSAGHRAPVNALTLMANGTEVVSGSSDRTLKRWQVRQDRWRPAVRQIQSKGVLQDPGQAIAKAVRTLKHLPKNVEQVAAGLENGEIQIWDISPSGLEKRFHEAGKPDRVFALDFTSDSQSLFSGHGSGVVRRWNLQGDPNIPTQKLYPTTAERFAVATLTVIEPLGSEPFVAIGGQFNRLMLWDWQHQRAYNVPYLWLPQTQGGFAPVFSRQSYVTALASANRVGLMASADNQGFITLWNLQPLLQCMASVNQLQAIPTSRSGPMGDSPIKPIKTDVFQNQYFDLDLVADCPEGVIADQWQGAPNGQGVRSLALAENGCYLASGGDDGRVVLWSLAVGGKRAAGTGQPAVLQQLRTGVNGVDIHHTRQGNAEVVLVVNDTHDYRVQVHRRQVSGHGCN